MPFPSSSLYPSSLLFPSSEDDGFGTPGVISWSERSDRYFETGLDRGVFYPNGGSGIPWNGLISVNEKGADSASEFYMDGRPFLYLPKPKEFSATLTAYTYPDEFSKVMGIVEVADGMYIDSQRGDSFGLSYRTLIGNDVAGTDLGYKIHLVYNVTVDPQAISYASVTNSVDPTDFSWEIKAVPVAITDYRSSAHIVIDTRHLDDARRIALEELLYGTPTTPAQLPSPQTLVDMLNFGDAITITDNGDGTWTAEGSYRNIYLLTPDVFQIDNVTAVDNGDGTYDISSTP